MAFAIQRLDRPAPPFRSRKNPLAGRWESWAGEGTVFVRRQALDGIRWAAERASPEETLGLLAGRVFRDDGGLYTLVVGARQALRARQSRRAVFADPLCMRELRRRLLAAYPAAQLVGWWHTHPGIGTHYSGVDRETQSAFREAWQIGIVHDPTRGGPESFGVYRGPKSARLSPAQASTRLSPHGEP